VKVSDLFASSTADEGHRVCGTCGIQRPLEDFYKDGTDKDGKVKYRRDCKDCYKRTRMQEAKLKKGAKHAI